MNFPVTVAFSSPYNRCHDCLRNNTSRNNHPLHQCNRRRVPVGSPYASRFLMAHESQLHTIDRHHQHAAVAQRQRHQLPLLHHTASCTL